MQTHETINRTIVQTAPILALNAETKIQRSQKINLNQIPNMFKLLANI